MNWLGVAVGPAVSLAVGLTVGLVVGVAFGVECGVAFGVVFGVGMGILGVNVAFGVVLGLVLGVLFGVVMGVGVSVKMSMIIGVGAGIGAGIGAGMAENAGTGVAAGVGFWIGYFRILNYLVEAPFSFWLSRRETARFSYSPLWWDELIWPPLPGLDQHLIHIARRDRKEGLEAIVYVAASFRQGWAAQKAVLSLMLDDIEAATDLPKMAEISTSLAWIPQNTREEMKSLLLGFDEISRHALAALEGETPYNRQEQLRMGLNLVERLRRGLAADSGWKAGGSFARALGTWEQVFSREYALAQEEKGIPNVYVAGSPLALHSKVFKGRRDIFRALERELVSQADQRPALLLFGARRMGKTSVLRQLPNAIGPQVIPVMVDLQNIALSEDAVSLFEKMAEAIQNSALVGRSITLPDISKKGLETEPYRAFSDWLEGVEKSIGERWILLCLDEYEYLEKLLQDGRIDERAFQLLRTVIQNHPRITLLFSGAHTLEDLPPLWSNYLINVRIVKINPLNEEDAEELIVRPIPDFPLVYEEQALDHLIFETGGHPYLIQSTCQDLVHRLNEENRFHAQRKDVESALNATLQSGAGYFNDLWNGPDSNDTQRAIQIEIAKAKSAKVSLSRLESTLVRANHGKQEIQQGIHHLIHRDILEQDDSHLQFRFELVRRWVRHQQLGLK